MGIGRGDHVLGSAKINPGLVHGLRAKEKTALPTSQDNARLLLLVDRL